VQEDAIEVRIWAKGLSASWLSCGRRARGGQHDDQRRETRLDGSMLIVRIPMRLQRRGGRKRIVAPDGSAIALADDPRPDGLFRLSGCIPPDRTTTRTSRGRLVPVLALGESSGKRDDCLPMFSDRNIHVVAGEIQKHALLG
jgi:hypothetical protein